MGGRASSSIFKGRLGKGAPLVALLVMLALALIGPSGVMVWSEQTHVLAEQQQELARLRAERDQLRNRVALVDPRHVDPDMAGELLRKDLNVVHPDEMVILLD